MKTLAVSQSARGSLLCRALIGSARGKSSSPYYIKCQAHVDRDVWANNDFSLDKVLKESINSLIYNEPDIMHRILFPKKKKWTVVFSNDIIHNSSYGGEEWSG